MKKGSSEVEILEQITEQTRELKNALRVEGILNDSKIKRINDKIRNVKN